MIEIKYRGELCPSHFGTWAALTILNLLLTFPVKSEGFRHETIFTAMIATFTAVLFFAGRAPANAQIAYTYYTAQSNGRDFGPVICCFANNNEVLNTLGPNGLPVYNPASTPVLQDRDPTTNERLWWTPSASTAPLYV